MSEGRIPPQSVEVEESLLGVMLIDAESIDIAVGELQPDDFYKPSNMNIYKSMLSLYEKGESINILTVENYLRDQKILDSSGGDSYLAVLTKSTGSESDIGYYCSIIKEKSMRRDLIRKCNDVIKNAYDTTIDTNDVIDQAQASVFSITESQNNTMHFIGETIHKTIQAIEEIQKSGMPLGLRSGLDIDDTLQGFQDAKLYVIGARPSMGKTSFILTIKRRLARDGKSSGILSLETSEKALHFRLLAQVSGIPADTITSGHMTAEQMQKVNEAAIKLESLGIIIDAQPALTIQQIRSKCRLMAKKGADIIFIDFLTLIRGDGRSKHEEIGEITKVLKQISKELDIPVVILAQLNREVEKRSDKRPQMSDLRESGSIEEDADAILFLYRPEYYGIKTDAEGNDTSGVCEVIIAKNKDGKTGVKRQKFIAETMTFENLEWKHKEFSQPPQPHYLDEPF